MCLILFACAAVPGYPLVIAANRDESHARPAAPAAFWSPDENVFGGRDLSHGGTWLGITRAGRWAAITNFREGGGYRNGAPSRGALAGDYLLGREAPERYARALSRRATDYNGFNLLAGDLATVWYVSNRAPAPGAVEPGIHGLSNHLLDTPWPKVTRGREALRAAPWQAGTNDVVAHLLAYLASRRAADPSELPDTGVGTLREKQLSPAFIAAEGYGTRASTVVLVDQTGGVTFVEHRFGPNGAPLGVTEERFALDVRATT